MPPKEYGSTTRSRGPIKWLDEPALAEGTRELDWTSRGFVHSLREWVCGGSSVQSRPAFQMVPKRLFADEMEVEQFRGLLKAKIGRP